MQLDSTHFRESAPAYQVHGSFLGFFAEVKNVFLRRTTHETQQTRDMKRVRGFAPADAEKRLRCQLQTGTVKSCWENKKTKRFQNNSALYPSIYQGFTIITYPLLTIDS